MISKGMPSLSRISVAHLWVGVILLALFGSFLWWVLNESQVAYPSKMLDNCPKLAVSVADESNNVVAKFEINQAKVSNVLKWYKGHGFTIAVDNSQTNGYGLHGLSFVIYGTNQTLMLVVSQWKDF